VPRFDPAEDGIRDACSGEIRTRIADDESAIARQDPSHLSHSPERIRIVMERVRAEDGRELVIIEGELLGIGDDETNVLDTGR
jgi:hypothetical protein